MQPYVFGTQPVAQVDWAALAACCAPDQYARIRSMRNPDAQRRSATGALLLAHALQQGFGLCIAPQDFAAPGPQGKPALRTAPVCFSLSHSGALVLCAVADTPVGVDVQQRRPVSQALARRVLSPAAYRSFCTAPDAASFFCQTWALKESYCKYTGRGLAQDLHALTVYPDASGGVHSSLCQPAFHRLAVPEGYAAALCGPACATPSICWVPRNA